MDSIEKLKDMIASSENIVFFGGAGVSTESGIPDFRSADGIYSRDAVIPPERILSHTFFINHTAEFFDFYKSNMIFRMQNRMPHISRLHRWNLTESSGLW